MAAYTITVVTPEGVTPTSNSAAASDTVAVDSGALTLWFIGGAGSDTVTITDAGLTPAGNAGVSDSFVLASGSSTFKAVKIPSALQNSSGVVTITHSAPTGVTVYALKSYF